MSAKPAPAIVVDGHTISGLTIIRSLGRRGVPVLALNTERPALADLSRYCREVIRTPSLFDAPTIAADRLARRLAGMPQSVLIAPTDPAVLLLNRFRERFAAHTIALPPTPTCEWALDKGQTVRLAQRLGVPVPRTWFPEDYGSPEALAHDATYPCVCKPRSSRFWSAEGNLVHGGDVRILADRAALAQALREHRGAPPLVQEFVTGEGRGVYLLLDAGKVRMRFAHRRVRESNPRGSGASLAEAVPVDPRLSDLASRLLSEIGWHGVAMVEFKVGREPYLMEINGRFWNSLPLSVQAGLDFPWQLYRLYTGHEVPECDYRAGTLSRYLRGDLSHVAHALRGKPRDWPGAYPSRLGAVGGFLRGCLPDVYSYTFAWDDPLPGLCELAICGLQRPVRET